MEAKRVAVMGRQMVAGMALLTAGMKVQLTAAMMAVIKVDMKGKRWVGKMGKRWVGYLAARMDKIKVEMMAETKGNLTVARLGWTMAAQLVASWDGWWVAAKAHLWAGCWAALLG